MSVQQVLIVETEKCGLRSNAVAWGAEDPSLYVHNKPVGLTPAAKFPHTYPTPLAALADGWRLLSPPTEIAGGGFEWWFVREKP